MKWYKYKIAYLTQDNEGENHVVLSDVMKRATLETLEIVKREAYNGEYTIEDDGEPDPGPTQLDRIEAQTTYTAMMTDTLLEV